MASARTPRRTAARRLARRLDWRLSRRSEQRRAQRLRSGSVNEATRPRLGRNEASCSSRERADRTRRESAPSRNLAGRSRRLHPARRALPVRLVRNVAGVRSAAHGVARATPPRSRAARRRAGVAARGGPGSSRRWRRHVTSPGAGQASRLGAARTGERGGPERLSGVSDQAQVGPCRRPMPPGRQRSVRRPGRPFPAGPSRATLSAVAVRPPGRAVAADPLEHGLPFWRAR